MSIRTPLLAVALLAAPATAHDLAVSNLTVTPESFREGDTVRVSYVIANKGVVKTQDFEFHILIRKPKGHEKVVAQGTLPGLLPAQRIQQTLKFKAPAGFDGPCDLIAWLDMHRKTWDQSRLNNRAVKQVHIKSKKPDLDPIFISASASILQAGTEYTFRATLRNKGTKLSPATKLHFYLSDDPGIDRHDTLLGTIPVPALDIDKGYIGAHSAKLSERLFSGPAWIVAIVDPDNEILEEDEDNNTIMAVLTAKGRPGVPAQAAHFQIGATQSKKGFGRVVANAGDVNADGVDDVVCSVISGTYDSARVYSGRDGSRIWQFTGNASGSYGYSARGAGDFNGDGYSDVVVGAPTGGSGGGFVYVYSGKDVVWLLRHGFVRDGSRFGHAVCCAGDVNGDGYDDVAVGAPKDPKNQKAGSVTVFSGKTRKVLLQVFGPPNSEFGFAIDGVGDVDKDGRDDLVVGAPNAPGGGLAFVVSGRTGQLFPLATHPAARTGAAVAGGGDVNGDGLPDILVGSPGSNGDSGYSLFSGNWGGLLHRYHSQLSGAQVGASVSFTGDIDGDGRDDYAVGSPGASLVRKPGVGQVRVYSGSDRSTILNLFGENAGDRYGTSIAAFANNDDGIGDLIVGEPGAAAQLGRVTVYKSQGKVIGRLRTYGAACPASTGLLPRNLTTGSANIGRRIVVQLSAAPASALAFLNLGVRRAALSLDGFGAKGCWALVTPFQTMPLATSADGRAAFQLDLPAEPGLVGLNLFTQWLLQDGRANQLGYITTRGGRIAIGKL